VAQAGTHSYASAYNFFQSNAQVAETRWAVVAGATGGIPQYWLTTGNPTAIQQANQTFDFTTNMSLDGTYQGANSHPNNANGVNTLSTAGVIGASTVVNEQTNASGWLLGGGNFGSQGNWATATKFTALTAEGAGNTAKFWFLTDSVDGLTALSSAKGPALFSYSSGVLTYTVPAVPEPSTYALFAAGLLGLLGLRRRTRS
jgi:hypothetical protein